MINLLQERFIKKIFESQITSDGAGVKLQRVFGFRDVPSFDPFLLLDFFGSDNPDDYLAGFPWHPHRGIETITYMLDGEVQHEDSLGNSGTIESGDCQWMTAGSGIIHQEMPKRSNGLMRGFQLWANLPARDKMMHPRYRDILKDQIPEICYSDTVTVKIISGEVNGVKGPVQDIVTDPEYLDVLIQPQGEFVHSIKKGHTVFAFIFAGEGFFDSKQKEAIPTGKGVLYKNGDEVKIHTTDKSVRFLLISGKPINEPVAWHGPIVMNFESELRTAFQEYQKGTFIKHKKSDD
ncbi:MAG: pirin family protein [Candidatus Heimdallarchaeota archaeon]